MSALKRQVLSGVFWSAVQKFGALFISFLANLVLARILSPDDFGNVGLLLVFVAIGQSFIDGGFGAALIQKRAVSNVDYSTVFYWNLIVSVISIAAIYFLAPIVGNYYHSDLLAKLLRVQSVVFLINAFSLVQTTKLTKELNFKVLSIRTILSTVIGAIVAILLAFRGWGVWSLVVKEIVSALVGAILLWSFCKWSPAWIFSLRAFREMFRFGSMILLSSIVDTVYRNIQSLIIGRAFSVRDLGYYTQAKKMEEIPVMGGTTILTQVLFPVYASIADQHDYMKSIVRKNIVLITYFTFPLMILLILIAPALITILFTEKWSASIPIFRILCIEGMLLPLNCANTEIFKAIGRSDVYFILQTVKRIISIVIILYSVQFGLYAMLWTIAATGFIFYAINIAFTHIIFGYKILEQLSDIIPNMILSVLSGIGTWYLIGLFDSANNFLLLASGTAFFAIIYLGLSKIANFRGLALVLSLIKRS